MTTLICRVTYLSVKSLRSEAACCHSITICPDTETFLQYYLLSFFPMVMSSIFFKTERTCMFICRDQSKELASATHTTLVKDSKVKEQVEKAGRVPETCSLHYYSLFLFHCFLGCSDFSVLQKRQGLQFMQ